MEKENHLPVSILLSAVIIASSIIYSSHVLTGEGLSLGIRSGSTGTNTLTGGNNDDLETNPVEPVEEQTQFATVSMDDDPVLGDENAPITIIEFSDFECPFCQRHYNQTYPQLVQEYIDTGQAKLVFRDLPLSFHDPMATKAAVAANCAREQGGDTAYFEFHDLWFDNTPSNGTGLIDSRIEELANQVQGVNGSALLTCVNNGTYEDEVKQDLSDAQAYGATATPTFFIGETPSSGNEFEGEMLVGAQPFSAFQNVIDKYLE